MCPMSACIPIFACIPCRHFCLCPMSVCVPHVCLCSMSVCAPCLSVLHVCCAPCLLCSMSVCVSCQPGTHVTMFACGHWSPYLPVSPCLLVVIGLHICLCPHVCLWSLVPCLHVSSSGYLYSPFCRTNSLFPYGLVLHGSHSYLISYIFIFLMKASPVAIEM